MKAYALCWPNDPRPLLLAASGLMYKAIAEETGVSKEMVSDICKNKSWREYSSPFAGLGAR